MMIGAVVLVGMGVMQIARGFGDGYPFQVDAAWVRARPEAALFYPGSRLLAQSAQGEQDHPLAMSRASIPAQATSYLVVDASPDQVLAWYSEHLKGRGWDDTTDRARAARPHADYGRGTREFVHVDVFGAAPPGLAYSGPGTVYAFIYGVNPRY